MTLTTDLYLKGKIRMKDLKEKIFIENDHKNCNYLLGPNEKNIKLKILKYP